MEEKMLEALKITKEILDKNYATNFSNLTLDDQQAIFDEFLDSGIQTEKNFARNNVFAMFIVEFGEHEIITIFIPFDQCDDFYDICDIRDSLKDMWIILDGRDYETIDGITNAISILESYNTYR